MHTIDAQLETKATVTASDEAWGAIVETFTAAGSIDGAGEHQIDLTIRKGLASDQANPFSPPDTISLGYRQNLGEIHLGELSVLDLPPARQGPARIRSERGPRARSLRCRSAVLVRYWAPTGSSVLTGFVDWTIPRRRASAETLYDVRVTTLGDLSDHATFDLAAVVPHPRPDDSARHGTRVGGTGPAFVPAILASISGSQGLIDYHTQFVRSWAGFEGLYSDLLTFSANATVGPLLGSISLTDRLLAYRHQPGSNPLLPAADRVMKATLSANGTIAPWGTRLLGDGSSTERRMAPVGVSHPEKHDLLLGATEAGTAGARREMGNQVPR